MRGRPSWAFYCNPESVQLGTPLHLAGGTRINYECSFRDTTGTAVMEGQNKTENEMCMLIGAYWPRINACMAATCN